MTVCPLSKFEPSVRRASSASEREGYSMILLHSISECLMKVCEKRDEPDRRVVAVHIGKGDSARSASKVLEILLSPNKVMVRRSVSVPLRFRYSRENESSSVS